MGCDIHIITEIKKNGKWTYISEIPPTFNERNYVIFAVLANVRNSFCINGFQPKGLPDDLSCRKAGFESEMPFIKRHYENDTLTCVRMPDGNIYDASDERFKKILNTQEEVDAHPNCHYDYMSGFYVYDTESSGGEIVEISLKNTISFDKYLERYKDEYDKDAKDYGYWNVDFDCVDYHSHSYLSLKELHEYDTSDYDSIKVKVPKVFFDKFFEFGGCLPSGIDIEDDSEKDKSIIRTIMNAINPEVIVTIRGNHLESSQLSKGIKELENIADKYGVTDENIRIVFAFDN